MNRYKLIKELEGKRRSVFFRLKANKYTNGKQAFKDTIKAERLTKEIQIQKAYLDHEQQ